MNLDKILDIFNIDMNETKPQLAGTVGTVLAICYGLYTLLGEVIIPALQQAQGLLGG